MQISFRAASLLVGALCLVSLAGGLFCLGTVHLLAWLAPLPLWACYLIVAGVVSVPGIGLALLGYQRFRSVPLLEQSAESLQENLEWTTTPK